MMNPDNQIAFIGAGRMASAIVKGIIENQIFEPEEIVCTSAKDGTAESLQSTTGISVSYKYAELLKDAEYVVLACKPQQIKSLPEELQQLTNGKVIISILAGTDLKTLSELFPLADNLIRVMPNTPGQIGQGVSAFTYYAQPSEPVSAKVNSILNALGPAYEVPENKLDAVTGLSGSGPAYVFEFIAGLRDAGVAAGLEQDLAYNLALQTVKGAAHLLEAIPETPETHRKWVSSPGGTTLKGLSVLNDNNFRELLKDTVIAAAERSKELSKGQ